MTESPTPSRYRWSYRGVTFDFYRLCEIVGINGGPREHAVKKIIRAGKSGKSVLQDAEEARQCIDRWIEMLKEDAGLEQLARPVEMIDRFTGDIIQVAPKQ